ncbi:RagB/SusD family nutrient uptake outer membrane protein [Belliella sp. R4-6]|uniref:RagB/SusD family nutrient uptake outer membrane protein n=1 Tax=Belliella alkalica TaxID=1730871 RepID=A0ABS9VCZ4_9BACT|nr:RagB/SusD family nutrient uptake outer membrane protein [Belliella alkalica]MCH7414320.1 RagB/SusD family nutrient uptake outer membrane protein [Belliella alkalica]
MNTVNKIIFKVCILLLLTACDQYLDQKPRQSYVIPKSLSDFQALLDNDAQVFNQTPGGFVYASDELKITQQGFNAINIVAREYYSWDPNAFVAIENVGDWNRMYQQIFVSNIVLEGLEEIPNDQRNMQWNFLKGQALFVRGYAMYNLLQLFADPYSQENAVNSLGLPYPISSNVNLRYGRGNLEDTYQKMIIDLTEAAELLPSEIQYLTRPSKAAAYLVLAKTYLNFSNYVLAEEYASLSLGIKDDLMDFNDLDPSLTRPIPSFNQEQIYFANQISISQFSNQIHFDQSFLQLYHENDLRRNIYFALNTSTGLTNFRGSYTGNISSFGGLAVDETIFVLAEAKIRNSKLDEASELVNDFLAFRYRSGEIVPVNFQAENDPVDKLFEEKQKQLVFRGTRWNDLRRMMMEGRIQNNLTKVVGEEEFTLVSGEKKWTYLIPFGEVSRNEIPQNPR